MEQIEDIVPDLFDVLAVDLTITNPMAAIRMMMKIMKEVLPEDEVAVEVLQEVSEAVACEEVEAEASEAVMVDEVASEVVVGVDSVVEAVEVAEAAEDVEATLMVKAARNFKTTNQKKKFVKLQEQNSTTVHEKKISSCLENHHSKTILYLKAEDFVDKIFGCLFLKEQKKV